MGSSLLAFKGNVREEDFVTVEAVDFAAFLEAMDRPVALLKMDIEGAEVAVLERLLARGLHDRIERAFVEVHDRKIPELVEPTNRLRPKLHDLQVTHIALSRPHLCEGPTTFCSCPTHYRFQSAVP